MTPVVGLADLARVLARLPRGEAREAAQALGFAPPAPPPARQAKSKSRAKEAPRAPTATEHFAAAAARVAAQRAQPAEPASFWRVERYEPDRSTPAPSTPEAAPTLASPLLLSEQGGRLFAAPEAPPLTPWRHLWPLLHDALRTELLGRDPDVGALVRCWSRGETLARIPRVRRRAWAPRASVWLDASARLTPLWPDQERVVRGLRRVFGSALQERWLGREAAATARRSPRAWLAGERVDAATPVVVLGDLGRLGGLDAPLWKKSLAALARQEVRVTALVPWSTRRRRWCAAWKCRLAQWERRASSPGAAGAAEEAATQLLALSSTALFVQPGLLRALRWLLPGADIEAELRAWTHPDVAGADPSGLILRDEARAALQARFRAMPPQLQARGNARVESWHQHMPKELVYAEALLCGQTSGGALRSPHEPAARAFAERLAGMLERAGASAHPGWRRYGHDLVEALPPSAVREIPALQRIREVVGAWSALALRQVGDALVATPRAGTRWPSDEAGEGSPVAVLEAAGAELWVEVGGVRTQRVLRAGAQVGLDAGAQVALRGARGTLHARPWAREPWASAAGRDAYGLWAEVTVAGVAFRMRWVPPGRFTMGSPEGEVGRFGDDEFGAAYSEQAHEVVLTEGYWLGETPVTQALWVAVMGTNPSGFQSADRPVETVSWEDCMDFLRALGAKVPGLALRLPTEAEWEYACRGGTTTATWAGDLEILGENHAAVLDAIAWYGGNSGKDYEIEEHVDSSSWPNKQYPHTKAGTRAVGQKGANPFGLYDMLGNVWEWCSDWLAPYDLRLREDPTGPTSGTMRVLRGGSWHAQAGNVRAASRYAVVPGGRNGNIGFRLARGPSALP